MCYGPHPSCKITCFCSETELVPVACVRTPNTPHVLIDFCWAGTFAVQPHVGTSVAAGPLDDGHLSWIMGAWRVYSFPSLPLTTEGIQSIRASAKDTWVRCSKLVERLWTCRYKYSCSKVTGDQHALICRHNSSISPRSCSGRSDACRESSSGNAAIRA